MSSQIIGRISALALLGFTASSCAHENYARTDYLLNSDFEALARDVTHDNVQSCLQDFDKRSKGRINSLPSASKQFEWAVGHARGIECWRSDIGISVEQTQPLYERPDGVRTNPNIRIFKLTGGTVKAWYLDGAVEIYDGELVPQRLGDTMAITIHQRAQLKAAMAVVSHL